MPYFDRFDICEAYDQLEADYNSGGILWERPSNQRRMESCGVQLARMRYRRGMSAELTENAQEIYGAAVERLGLPR